MSEILAVRMPFSVTYTAPLALAILKSLTPEIKTVDLAPKFNELVSKLAEQCPYDSNIYDQAFAFKPMPSPFYRYFDWLLLNSRNPLFTRIEEEILRFKPKIITFSVNATNLAPTIIISKRLHRKGKRIIWGGCETLFAWKVLKDFKFIDHIIVGEAEPVWKDVLEEKIKEKVIFSPLDFDLNKSPIPDYSDLNLSNYKTIGIETQRGCINRCFFCNNRFTPYREKYREKSIKKVREEVKVLKKLNMPFYFCDNITNPTKERLIQLCKMLSKEKIKWHGEFQPKIDEEQAYWLKKSGCCIAALGLESMCDSVLRKMNKPITVAEQVKTVKNLKKYGIHVHAMFFFGFPTETFFEALISAIRIIKYSKYFDTLAIGEFTLVSNSIVHRFPHKFGIKLLPTSQNFLLMNAIPYIPRKPYLIWIWHFLDKYLEEKHKWWEL